MDKRKRRLLCMLEGSGRKNRWISGAPPLSFRALTTGELENYRIYGNTVGGESVGDRTGNLFDFGEWSKNINANDDNSLAKGIDGITITANSNDAFTTPYAYVHEGVYKIYVKPNTNYLLSWVSNNNLFGRVFIFKNGITDGTHAVRANNNTTKYLFFGTDADTEFITLRFGVGTAGNTINYSKIMLIEGSTPLPYEPYGYKVPVTVSNGTDTLTTPIYLPEPIKMVGDEAEYIDYAEQKQHRVRKNLLQNTSGSSTIFGVTYTVNDDGSITCNTDENGATRDSFYYPMGITLPSFAGKTIILSGGTTNIYVRAYHYQGNNTISSNGNDTEPFTMEQGFIDIYVPIGTVLNNVTIFPMARLASIADDTYEPYIENTDLDVTLPALPTLPGTNVLSVGTAVQPSRVEVKGRIKAVGQETEPEPETAEAEQE